MSAYILHKWCAWLNWLGALGRWYEQIISVIHYILLKMSRCFCLLPHLLGALCLLILLAAPNTYGVHVYHQTTHFSSKHDLFGPVGGILYNSLELLIVWPNSSFSSYISIFSHIVLYSYLLCSSYSSVWCYLYSFMFDDNWSITLGLNYVPSKEKKIVLHDGSLLPLGVQVWCLVLAWCN